MRGYSLFTTHSGVSKEVTYHVELWTQPLHRRLIAKAYHRYDMTMYRLPGFKTIEALILGWKMRGEKIATPWSANQDIRCYFLTRKGRRVLETFEVDESTYERLKGEKK